MNALVLPSERSTSALRRCLVLVVAIAVVATIAIMGDARAAFHLAVIDEIMTSYDGDASSQFVEIRMLSSGQGVVAGSKLSAFDSDGNFSSVVLNVPSDVAGGADRRWIMGTTQFEADSGITADFTFAGGLPTDGGMVCWGKPGNEATASQYVDCIAYGNYSGPSNSQIGTPTPLTAVGHSLVRLSDTGDNATDFACGDPATPENNAGTTADMAATTACAVDHTVVWDASSGLFPDELMPAWTLVDTAEPEEPMLAGGVLTLSTSEGAETMMYRQDEPLLDVASPFTLEFRMRFVSGASSGTSRATGFVAVTVEPNTGAVLFIDRDEIFLTTDGDLKGDSALVDTDDAAHDYRLDVAENGTVTVRYDGVPTLSGATWVSAGNHGSVDRVLFGEGSTLAFGELEFESFRHNATVVITTTTSTSTSSTTMPPSICGDANVDMLVSATDALLILQTAVGQPNVCPPERCDADGSGSIVASDALRVLQFAVGLDVTLMCPAV